MVSNTLCPAMHILGSQNVYSRLEGITLDFETPGQCLISTNYNLLDCEFVLLIDISIKFCIGIVDMDAGRPKL